MKYLKYVFLNNSIVLGFTLCYKKSYVIGYKEICNNFKIKYLQKNDFLTLIKYCNFLFELVIIIVVFKISLNFFLNFIHSVVSILNYTFVCIFKTYLGITMLA